MVIQNIKLALGSMKGGKMRTVLSLLGIIIGVASVVTILTLGNSATGSITDSITSSGYDLIYLSPAGSKNRETFDELFAEKLRKNVDGIGTVMPTVSSNGRVRNGSIVTSTAIMGVNSDYAVNMDYKESYGKWFGVEDNIFKRQVAVLGSAIAEKLFPGGNAVGNYITIFRDQGKKYLVVAVMEEKDASLGASFNNTVYIPYNTYAQRFQRVTGVGTYVIKVAENFDPKEVNTEATTYLDDLVGSDNYMMISSASLADMVSSVTGTLSIFLAAIGGISLLVGGIGIMNIMLVSVAERTKEIGIRKALGASPRVIRGQFLTEAITLTSFGGVVGIVLGIGLSKIVANIAGWGFAVSVNACLLSVGFSMAIGIFFGLYPAAKAAKMDPIDSLNYE
jgi:putative ABC transport system permease protein